MYPNTRVKIDVDKWCLHSYYSLCPYAPDNSGRLLFSGCDPDTGVGKVYIAQIGENGAKFETLAEAIAAAQAGDTIILLRDVTLSEILTIDKAITLDGNGKALTSTASRAINVETAGIVTINNLNIVFYY